MGDVVDADEDRRQSDADVAEPASRHDARRARADGPALGRQGRRHGQGTRQRLHARGTLVSGEALVVVASLDDRIEVRCEVLDRQDGRATVVLAEDTRGIDALPLGPEGLPVAVVDAAAVHQDSAQDGLDVQLRHDRRPASEGRRAGGAGPPMSPRAREPEVDLRRAGIGPARCDDLGPRVELDAFWAVHVEVAEEAVLPATEAVVRHGDRDRHVDADHAGVHLELELAGRSPVAGEDGRAVAVRVVVDQADRLLVRLDADDREHRAEDLVAVRVHRRA